MASSRRLSLRQRLLLWLLPPILLLIGIWGWAAYAVVIHFAGGVYDWVLEDAAHTLAAEVKNERGSAVISLRPSARRILQYDQIDRVYFSVTDDHGRDLVGNRVLPAYPSRTVALERTRFYDAVVDGRPVRIAEYATRFTTGDVLFIRVAETTNKRSALARRILIYMMVPQLLLLAALVLLAWLGIGRGIAPLKWIQAAIAQRSHDDLTPLDDAGLPAEVHEQVRVINDLMQRLGAIIVAQRRFVADAAHQLRTPITAIRTQAELALRAGDADEAHALITSLAATSARLARIANQLLNLSRAEAGLGLMDRAALAPAALIEDVVADLVPAALDKGIDVRVEIAESLPALRGNRVLLGEMLANLVDNAIRYTPAGGRVKVGADAQEGRVRFIVSDSGSGIAEAEREKVLQRFYRTADAGAEGSGLGLAIAQEIAIAHGGRIMFEPRGELHGLTVVAEIPVTSSHPLPIAAAR